MGDFGHIDDNRQVNEAAPHWDVADVHRQNLVRLADGRVPQRRADRRAHDRGRVGRDEGCLSIRSSFQRIMHSGLWDDGVIDPMDTRNALAIAISASPNARLGEPGYGVFRL